MSYGLLFDRGVSSDRHGEQVNSDVVQLPLNLIALIISYLDEPGDLARTCRTSRVLHYMTLPQLYSNVSLHSYDHIRYSPEDGRPEGCGGASPFFTGLSALVTRNVAGYVKKFRVWGTWKECDTQDCGNVGRVPDGSMMLSTLVRAAIDRMPALESFSWELDTKMLQTVWIGLVQRQSLTSLKVTFPTKRQPRPVIIVPPILNLRSLYIGDIDPLCYPDDISLLLLGSKKLRDLKLHFSPRMREARELSVTLNTYFGRAVAAGYALPLKSFSIMNLYAHNDGGFTSVLNALTTEAITFFNSVGSGNKNDTSTSFVDQSWKFHPPKVLPNLKQLRLDRISRVTCDLLGKTTGLERYYLTTGRSFRSERNGAQMITPPAGTPSTDTQSGEMDCSIMALPTTPATLLDAVEIALGKDYLSNIFKNHGSTLRHLLLPPQWRLSSDDIARLVRSCPNLEQLGLGVEVANFNMIRLLIPFLPRLYAIRILDHVDHWGLTDTMREKGEQWQEQKMGNELWKEEWNALRWVGLGELVYEVGDTEVVDDGEEGGEVRYRRTVRRRPIEMVKDIEIWSMDRLEI